MEETTSEYRRWNERDLKSRKVLDYGKTNKDYASYWAGKPTAWQNNAVGPKRAQMVRDKVIKIGDLSDRETGRLFTIKELERKFS